MSQTLEIGGKPAISGFIDHFRWRIAHDKPQVIRVTDVSSDFKIVESDNTFTRGTKHDLLLRIDGVLSVITKEKFNAQYLATGYSFKVNTNRRINQAIECMETIQKGTQTEQEFDDHISIVLEILSEVKI